MGKGGLVTLIRDSLDYTEITPQDGIECIPTKIKSDNCNRGDHLSVSAAAVSDAAGCGLWVSACTVSRSFFIL